jgi:hypothetical protein
MSDKRTVATDALATLGTVIDSSQRRDAIHLATEPAIAGEELKPGQHVFYDKFSRECFLSPGYRRKPVGIVDPFLKEPLDIGDQFWLILYPGQITTLRHTWTHPDFLDEADVNYEQVDDECRGC